MKQVSAILALCLIALVTMAPTWSKYNNVTVGTSAGNISKWNGITIGTTAGNIKTWNTLSAPGGGAGISHTDRGVCTAASASSCTMSVTLATGSTLVVWSSTGGLSGTITATWNGNSMTEITAGIGTGGIESHLFHLDNVTGATANLVCTSTGGSIPEVDCGAVEITGAAAAPVVASDSVVFTGTSDSTPTVATTTTNNLILGLHAQAANTTSAAGAGANNTTSTGQRGGQATGTCCVVEEFYGAAATAGNYAAGVSGLASTDNALWVIALKP